MIAIASRPRSFVALVAAVVVCLGGWTGCSSASDTTASASVSAPNPPAVVANDLATNSAHHTIPVPGEGFDVSVDYWTSTDIAHWQSDGAKPLNLSLHLAPHPDAPSQDVLLYKMTVSVQAKATLPAFDGVEILNATDTATGVPGFLISANYPYESVVKVPAMAQTLVDRWKSVGGNTPLTSAGLRKYGVYANTITYTYDLLIKNPGDVTYHKRTVSDVLTVPSDAAS
jgi:hypothetical protein